MSFRKRGEVLNGARAPPGATQRTIPGRSIPGRTPNSIVNARGGPQSTSSISDRMASMNIRGRVPDPRISSQDTEQELDNVSNLLLNHPGIRPSPVSATFATSTGSNDLDKVLTHMGLPLGNSILVEEQGTTEFNSILAKLFVAQGIVHNRIGGSSNASKENGNTHAIVISLNQMFAKELPGIYKGSRKDVKKQQITEEQSKISVQNLTEQNSTPQRYKDFKIAWKYKLADEQKEKVNAKNASQNEDNDEYKDYNHQFDITSRIMPAASNTEISFISPNLPVTTILSQVEQIIKRQPGKLIRIVIPSFLHPAMYPPASFATSKSIALMHGLRSIVKVNDDRCVLFASVATDTLNKLLKIQIENVFDSVVNLEPFPQDMLQFLERIYKSQPNKVQHGLLHVLKLPVFSERGEMQVKKSEWAFRNGRKRFEIDEWSIPVDDVENSTSSGNPSNGGADHAHASEGEHSHNTSAPDATAPKNTKISLEY